MFPEKNLYPGGIRTRVFLFLRQMRSPLRHTAKAKIAQNVAQPFCVQIDT
jgi:hypothetical protein